MIRLVCTRHALTWNDIQRFHSDVKLNIESYNDITIGKMEEMNLSLLKVPRRERERESGTLRQVRLCMLRIRPGQARNLFQNFRRNGNLELLEIFSMQFSFCVLISVGRSLTDSRLELLYVEQRNICFNFVCGGLCLWVCMHQPLPDHFVSLSARCSAVLLWFYLYIEIVLDSSCHKFHIIIWIVCRLHCCMSCILHRYVARSHRQRRRRR